MNDSLFTQLAQICLISAGILALLTLVTWVRQLKIRFAMVGYTGFALVLAVGCFALGLGPFMRTTIPGAASYTTVYDQGANQAVIAVAPTITPEALTLTLQQAALNLSTSGRFSTGSPYLTIKARTVTHPEAGISQLNYLGQLQKRLGVREDPEQSIEIFEDRFAQLNLD